MDKQKLKRLSRMRRARRIRTKIRGTKSCPRLCVFRSLKHIYAQLIDDESGRTLVYANDFEIKNKSKIKKIDVAREVGRIIAEKAKNNNIVKVVFDKGHYKYHGRIRALADGAREGGLKF